MLGLGLAALFMLFVAARTKGFARSAGVLLAALLAGYLWSTGTLIGLLQDRLPECMQERPQRLLVRVLQDPSPLPGPIANSVRLYVQVLAQQTQGCADLRGRRLRLSWYGAAAIAKEQRWWIEARLKVPWGSRNPGGFDVARWMLGERLQGSGYVRSGSLSDVPADTKAHRLRQALRRELAAPDLPGGSIIFALITGDSSLITPQTWDVLRDTGTVHLMVVSGLHVGLVAALGYFFGSILIRGFPVLLLWLPAHRAGIFVSLMTAGGYVLLTGGGVPAQRAWLMAALFMLSRLLGRRVEPFDVLLLVFVCTLLIDPVNVHRQGFWLSFSAVAVLLAYFRGRVQARGRLRLMLQTQIALAVGLTPCLALLVGSVPPFGPLANLLAVPVMSFLVLPGSLLSALLFTFWPTLGGFGFVVLSWVVSNMMDLLAELSGWLVVFAQPGVWVGLGAITASVAVLLGVSKRGLVAALLLWLAWLWHPSAQVPAGEFRIVALDVGQGSAIVVDTRRRRLLFDTGPGFPGGFNLASGVIVPSLVATGPARLDAMVLSHADLDHTGGADAIASMLPVDRKLGSRGSPGVDYCQAGIAWEWDGVSFEFLNPHSLDAAVPDNDRSCVLRVANAQRSALLTGDISVKVERQIGRSLPPVDLMFAPHHGSRSSSSKAFVRLLGAKIVFVSAGYANRFGHPHPSVLSRYAQIGARIYVTGLHGALIWRSDRPAVVENLRAADSAPYWTIPERTVIARPAF
jgi:competence protein ComEC